MTLVLNAMQSPPPAGTESKGNIYFLKIDNFLKNLKNWFLEDFIFFAQQENCPTMS